MADPMINQSVNYGLKAMELEVTAMSTVADIVYQGIKMFDSNSSVRAMNSLIKSNQTEYIMCDIDEMQSLKSRLEKNGVGMDPNSRDKLEGVLPVIVKDEYGKERGMVIYNKKYHNIALDTLYMFNAERKGGLVDIKTLENYSDGMMKKIEDLDKTELLMFDKQCKMYNVPYCIQGPEDNKYDLIFADRDQEEMERIKMDSAITLSTPARDIYIKQLEYENKNALNIRYAVLNGVDKETNKNIEAGTTIVDRKGNVITFDKKGVYCVDSVTTKFYKRNSPDFKHSVDKFVCDLEKPVMLNSQEYKQYRLEKDKNQYLIQNERKKGCPVITEESIVKIGNNIKIRTDMEKNIVEKHPIQMVKRIEDCSIEETIFSFTDKENLNLNQVITNNESMEIEANYYSDAEAKFASWDIDDCSITARDIEIEQECINDYTPEDIDIQEDIYIDSLSEDIPHRDLEDHDLDL